MDDHNELGEQVLRTLLYFDIFSYPLEAEEIFAFLQAPRRCRQEMAQCLNALVERKHVFRFGNLYSLHPDEKNIVRRLKGNDEARKCMKVAVEKARLIARFPFVQAVMASGSLSKGYMDEQSDIDFFIVTAPNRLWIARTLLVIYKRLFLLNSHKQFCVNYFVDIKHLEIEEKNLYTATELATLIPLYNHVCYQTMLESNQWIHTFLPNFKSRPRHPSDQEQTSLIKTCLESLLRPFASVLDTVFMKLSLWRWNKLYADQYSSEDFNIAFKTRRHVSKNHPKHYQKKILALYQEKLMQFKPLLEQATVL